MVVQLKSNQKELLRQIQHGCCVQGPIDVHEDDIEKSHGRLEHRKYEVFSALPMLNKWQKDWGDLQQIVRVTRYRERLNSTQASTEEVHYYVSNGSLTAKALAIVIRNHWYIENKLHYVKDVAFQEDNTVKRVKPGIFSTCIDFALNRIRISGENNIKGTLYENSLCIKTLLNEYDLFLMTSTP